MRQPTATLAACLFIMAFGFMAGRETKALEITDATYALYACSERMVDAEFALLVANESLKMRIETLMEARTDE